MDKFKKHLVQPTCDQKPEASEAAEYRMYDVKMILNRFKTRNAGSADSILLKLGQLIPLQERAKDLETATRRSWFSLRYIMRVALCTIYLNSTESVYNSQLFD